MAKNAFFDFSKADIQDFMEYEGKPVSGKTLLEVLVQAVVKCLGYSESKAMELVKKRVVSAKNQQDNMGEFMQLDVVQANLDDEDNK